MLVLVLYIVEEFEFTGWQCFWTCVFGTGFMVRLTMVQFLVFEPLTNQHQAQFGTGADVKDSGSMSR